MFDLMAPLAGIRVVEAALGVSAVGAGLAGSLPGSLLRDVVGGPVLDPGQTGYGAAYRIYQGADGAWFALAVPDEQAWRGLLSVVHLPELPHSTPSLRTDRGDSQPEELLLGSAFGTRRPTWVAALRAEGVPVEPVATPDRERFAAGFTAPVQPPARPGGRLPLGRSRRGAPAVLPAPRTRPSFSRHCADH
jgi:hypothetical protein